MPRSILIHQDELASWLYGAFLGALKGSAGSPRSEIPFTETLRGVCTKIAGELEETFNVSRRK